MPSDGNCPVKDVSAESVYGDGYFAQISVGDAIPELGNAIRELGEI